MAKNYSGRAVRRKKPAAKKRKALWIESTDRFNDLAVGTQWGGGGFRSNAEKLRAFNAIKAALEKEFPDRVVNPWSDAPWGTPDFGMRMRGKAYFKR